MRRFIVRKSNLNLRFLRKIFIHIFRELVLLLPSQSGLLIRKSKPHSASINLRSPSVTIRVFASRPDSRRLFTPPQSSINSVFELWKAFSDQGEWCSLVLEIQSYPKEWKRERNAFDRLHSQTLTISRVLRVVCGSSVSRLWVVYDSFASRRLWDNLQINCHIWMRVPIHSMSSCSLS